ncbi:MAG: biopolymer transporter ExbD [Myxococcota bacterium]
MPRRSLQSPEEETEINLSPMIDCIFILLIFFIVTTVFVEEKGLSIAKPDAAAVAMPDEEREDVVLEITQQNEILLNDAAVSLADVARGVQAKVSDPDTPVVIRAHEKSSHGIFVGVWDAARRGGARHLSFSTVN